MKKSNIDIEKLREQIFTGLELSFQKLLKQKKEQNGVFVFSENGKIIKIKASDLDK